MFGWQYLSNSFDGGRAVEVGDAVVDEGFSVVDGRVVVDVMPI